MTLPPPPDLWRQRALRTPAPAPGYATLCEVLAAADLSRTARELRVPEWWSGGVH